MNCKLPLSISVFPPAEDIVVPEFSDLTEVYADLDTASARTALAPEAPEGITSVHPTVEELDTFQAPHFQPEEAVQSISDHTVQSAEVYPALPTEAGPVSTAPYETYESDNMSESTIYYDARSDIYTSDTDKFYTPSRGSLASLAAFSVKSFDDLEDDVSVYTLETMPEEDFVQVETTEETTHRPVLTGLWNHLYTTFH